MADEVEYENIPKHFLCPITQEIMKNPNINEAGQTYEYEAIVEWYAMGNRSDPLTRKEIKNTQFLVPNQVLKSQILEWKEKYPKEELAELERKRKVREREDFKLACETYFRLNQKIAQKKRPQNPPTVVEEKKEEPQMLPPNSEDWTREHLTAFVRGLEKGEKWTESVQFNENHFDKIFRELVKTKKGVLPSNSEDWTTEHLATFIKGLGKGKKWTEYAQLCENEGLDGSILVGAKSSTLQKLGFSEIHSDNTHTFTQTTKNFLGTGGDGLVCCCGSLFSQFGG
jgi:hypothetical protein